MALSNRFDALDVEETASWDLFKETINDLVRTHIGTSKITKKEWISDVTHNLIIEKRQSRLQHRLTDYKQLRSELGPVCGVTSRHGQTGRLRRQS